MGRSEVFAPLSALLALGCASPEPPPPRPIAPAAAPPPSVSSPSVAPASSAPSASLAALPTSPFCAPLGALEEDACAFFPASVASPPRLLVYLHGILPPEGESPSKANVLSSVASASERAGAVALVPRGIRGVGPKGAHDWLAWPTDPRDHAAHARALVARWSSAKVALEARLGRPFARTYLAGSSNGAYFVAALAARDDLARFGFPVDGLGAMSGGGAVGLEPPPGAALPPFYVGYGTYDDDTKRNASSLVALLQRRTWPSRVAEHPFGHGARAVYLDEAFAFWDARAR